MIEITLYSGPIIVKRRDGTERTYSHAPRARQFYRAAPDHFEPHSATIGRCDACQIRDSQYQPWCVGIDGGCPRAIREAMIYD